MKISIKVFVLLILAFTVISCASLQKILTTIGINARIANKTLNDVRILTQQLRLTKTEFDKTVKVFKVGSAATNRKAIPKGKENKLEIAKGKTKNLNWEPVAYFDSQLFPSVIVSMATYKEPVVGSLANSVKSGALGFSFVGKKSYIPMKYEIESTDSKYFNKCSGEFIYQTAGQTEVFMPEIPWKFEALTKQYTNKPLKIYYRIFDENGNKSEKLITVTLRSIDDCIFSYNGYDMDFMFAAYVQEQHPEIDKILREGINTKIVKSWIGYQAGSAEVDKQIAAIWRVLHERGFVYSNISDNAGDQGKVVSQAVRTFNTSIKTSQANCVDGTIVFASILKRIGIRPFMVMVPGHCFLAYFDKSVIKYLETTMLGEEGNLRNCKTNEAKNREYINLFKKAQETGLLEYKKYKKDEYANLIDVTAERKRVNPIPYYAD